MNFKRRLIGAVGGLILAVLIVTAIPGDQPWLGVVLGFGLTWLGMELMGT